MTAEKTQADRNELAQRNTDQATTRTQMAATRTFFAMLRTGLAIAGGGALVTTILAEGWPDWIVGLLVAFFILVGFIIVIVALWRYMRLASELKSDEELSIIAPGLLLLLTAVLMIAIIVSLVLFLADPPQA